MRHPWSSNHFGPRAIVAAALSLGLISCLRTPQEKSAAWVHSAKTAIEHKDYTRAIGELQNALQEVPRSAEAHYQMGLALMNTGSLSLAVRYFRNAADLEPSRTDAHLKIAQLLRDTQDKQLLAFAEQHAKAAWEQRPNDPEALYALGVVEWREEKTRLAVEHLQRALTIAPAHLNSAAALASIQYSTDHDSAAAERTLRDAVKHSSNSAEAIVALGRFYLTAGQPEAAESQFRQAIGIDPNYGPALLELAKRQELSGRSAEAGQTLARLSSLPDKSYRTLHPLFLLQHGQHDAAIAELKRYWDADPGNAEVRERLIDVYLQTNQLSAAEQVLTTALRGNARDADALERLGQLYLRQRRLPEAEKSLAAAVRIRPESAFSHYTLAQVYGAQGRSFSQRQELQLAVERDPGLLSARVELAQSLRLGKALGEALGVIDRAPAAQKRELPLLVERVWVLFALQRYTDAGADIRQALTISRTPAVLLQAGLMELHEKRYAAARVFLEEALSAAPDDVETLNAIAYTLASENKVPAAIEKLRKQAARLPGSAAVQFALGSWLHRTGDLAAAGAAYAAALGADPAYAPALVGVARLDMIQGRWESARNRVNGVLGKDPRNVDGLLALGMIEEGTGRYDAAIKAYRAVLEVEPAHAVAKNNLVVRLSENPATCNEAVQFARQLKQAVPDDPEIDDTAGWAYYKAGQYRTAINYLENSVAGTKHAGPRYHLAMAYFAAGERDRGQKALAAAKELNPHLPEAALAQKMAESAR